MQRVKRAEGPSGATRGSRPCTARKRGVDCRRDGFRQLRPWRVATGARRPPLSVSAFSLRSRREVRSQSARATPSDKHTHDSSHRSALALFSLLAILARCMRCLAAHGPRRSCGALCPRIHSGAARRLPRRRDVHRTRTRSPGSSGVGNTASHPAGSAGGAHSKIQRASLGARLTQPCERAVPKRSCQYTPCNA